MRLHPWYRATQRLSRIGACLVVIVAGVVGCKQGEKGVSANEQVPADLEIIIGQQGTFAGRSRGYTIRASGEIARWEGKYPGEHVEATGTLTDAQITRLWKEAQEIGLLEMQSQTMSTVHSFVTIAADGESRRVTWDRRDEDALTPAQQFYDECMAIATGAFKESEG